MSSITIANYIEVCPFCDSENIVMVGDPEFNDFWECNDCQHTFNTFKLKTLEENL